ncbi:MAG: glycosyltransferase family 2 protein [Faecalibacterium prausnitzii]
MKDLSKVNVSVIVVTYNNREELDDCINSIFQMNDIGKRLEVIVVDNSPNDLVKIRVSKYEKVKYVRNIENGFGKGNNIGYKESIGDLLIFLNPDTILIEPIFFEDNSQILQHKSMWNGRYKIAR